MALLRTLAHLMLVLALLAGGLAPGAAVADAGMAGGMAMAEPCHDLAGDPVGPTEAPAADCCDGGCACDCLHSVQAGLMASFRPAIVPARDARQRPFEAAGPTASGPPEGRPPIA